ncbi:unnamed protein product [Notodromas monacha]|uniref:Peptidase S1 domain-containing protein n=1 Tax=Notodromas monacha TaxID=399045 RepID=A0A7R9BIV6_9CRUS|nr:unnamed protein product [Notodromas monacha]CAG0916355.1 unnamed protein product [Notodromas monacha]
MRQLGLFATNLACIFVVNLINSAACNENGYPETRGLTVIGSTKLTCGRRFFTATRDGVGTAAIVGGRDAEPGEFPFIVSITHGAKEAHFCGGSLIGTRHVLTAAHCLQKLRTNLQVKVREYDIFRTEQPPAAAFPVSSFDMHPGWNPSTLIHDLAIITLDKAVDFDSFAQPVCLPCCPNSAMGGVDHLLGQNLTVAGWGATVEGGTMSPILQKVSVPIIDYGSCKSKLFPQFFIAETHVCAGLTRGGKDSCQGDSGGPLFKEEEGFMTIEGVVSAGIGCARPDMPGVYTRVSEYVPWIMSIMNSGSTETPAASNVVPDKPKAVETSTNKIPDVAGAFFDEASDNESSSRPNNHQNTNYRPQNEAVQWIANLFNLFGGNAFGRRR